MELLTTTSLGDPAATGTNTPLVLRMGVDVVVALVLLVTAVETGAMGIDTWVDSNWAGDEKIPRPIPDPAPPTEDDEEDSV